ncbi:MAG TPA: AAA family ATPase [Candidatus Sulfotelmatobacter sp.]
MAAKLVIFEGPDGVGKSTLLKATSDLLAQRKIPFLSLSFPGKTPGTLGELVDRIHHTPQDLQLNAITPLALQALHIAVHLDAIDTRIKPALNGFLRTRKC